MPPFILLVNNVTNVQWCRFGSKILMNCFLVARKVNVFCLSLIIVCGVILIYAVLFHLFFISIIFFNTNNNIMDFFHNKNRRYYIT